MAVTVALLALVGTWATVNFGWFPILASDESGQIDSLYTALLWVSVPFAIGIIAFILFEVWQFRARPGHEGDGPPIHGNTRLEIVWTSIPFIIVTVVGIYGWIVLDDLEAKQPNELNVKVIGQQFAWRFEYPGGVKSNELVVPVDRPLYFTLTSDDVIHSFFIPAVRLKRDATQGAPTPLRFTPNREGSYEIVCAELCGVGHSTMRQTMRVVPTAEYDAWFKKQSGGSTAGASTGSGDKTATIDGKQVFTGQGCGACHALADAKTQGAAGPELDSIGSKGEAFVRASIVTPEKAIAQGYSAGIMPSDFKEKLSQDELDALVGYLVKAGK